MDSCFKINCNSFFITKYVGHGLLQTSTPFLLQNAIDLSQFFLQSTIDDYNKWRQYRLSTRPFNVHLKKVTVQT